MAVEPEFPEKPHTIEHQTDPRSISPHTQDENEISLRVRRQDTTATATAHRRAKEDRHLPYPRWATILLRSIACIVEIGTVAYTAWLLAKWSGDGDFRIRRGGYDKILGAVSLHLHLRLQHQMDSSCACKVMN